MAITKKACTESEVQMLIYSKYPMLDVENHEFFRKKGVNLLMYKYFSYERGRDVSITKKYR